MLAAFSSNKELTRKDENGDHSEVYVWLVMSLVLNLVLCGLGFLYPARATIHQTNFLFPLWFFTAAVTATTKGTIKVISRIMWVAFLAYVVMGSFM